MMPGTEDLVVPRYLPTAEEFLDFGDYHPLPECQILHVSAISPASIDGLYEMEDGTKLLLKTTTVSKDPASVRELKKILAFYRSHDSQVSLDDFIYVFVVPDQATRVQCLKDWVQGINLTIGQDSQVLRVGVMVIDAAQTSALEVSLLVCQMTHRENLFRYHIQSLKRKAITRDGKIIDRDPGQ